MGRSIQFSRGLLVLFLSLSPSFVRGAVIYDSGGFEPPRFTTTPNPALENQDPIFGGPWFRDNAGPSTAVIQTAINNGTSPTFQAVKVDRAASTAGDSRWGVVKNHIPADRFILVDWDERVEQTVVGGLNFGPFFGIETYDAVGFTFPLIGALGVDASTGDVLVQDGTTGAYEETGTIVNFGQWYSYTLELDYLLHKVRGYVNGVPVSYEDFVDDSPSILGFSDADIAAVNAEAGKGAISTGTAYFDNYRINSSNAPLPEPASLGYLAFAGIGLLRRARKGSAAE